jgi:3-phenylpropionate/cinnamic acid dioxygenase small subunit
MLEVHVARARPNGLDIADRLAIGDRLIAYGSAIDQKNWSAFRACFTDDCAVRFGELAWRGVDVVTEIFVESHRPLDASMHRVTNIEITGSNGDLVHTRAYCDAVLIRRGAPGGPVLQVLGVYTDRLAFQGGSWRIASRDFRAELVQGDLGVLGLSLEDAAATYGGALRM